MGCGGVSQDEKREDKGLALETPQLPTTLQCSDKEMETHGWAHLVLEVTKRPQKVRQCKVDPI